MSTNKKQPEKPVTISKQGETPIEVSAAYWELLKQAGGYGYKEVIETPAELLGNQIDDGADITKEITQEDLNLNPELAEAGVEVGDTVTFSDAEPFPDVLDTIIPDPNLAKLRQEQEQKIQELEEQKKAATGQDKANLTKEIKKLKAELI